MHRRHSKLGGESAVTLCGRLPILLASGMRESIVRDWVDEKKMKLLPRRISKGHPPTGRVHAMMMIMMLAVCLQPDRVR